ncbi:MAG TPA: hypothetical protein ENJ00_06015, partial [Phycisphaerales bacterium]|nr:hypothetical protein [Phycisphaerales bacterium]
TIAGFAERCAAAAGKSTNFEIHAVDRRFGGNGPLLAHAMASIGTGVTYVGSIGQPGAPDRVDPLYDPLVQRCERVVSVSPAAATDALEFDDGKLMFNKPANVQAVTWPMLVERIGLDAFRSWAETSTTIAVVNWVLMQGVEGIWRGLMNDVLPELSPNPNRRMFVDLSDPAKRTDSDIARAMRLLSEMNDLIPVMLGLNLAEAQRIATVLGVDAGPEDATDLARVIRIAVGLECCVVHPRHGAAAATTDQVAWFDGPFTRSPRLSTGAGDHFNGGFVLARGLGFDLGQCLAVGCAVSGAYVRDGVSPGRARLERFLRTMPPRQSP